MTRTADLTFMACSRTGGDCSLAGQFFGYPWKQGQTRITDEGYDKDPLPGNITDPQVLTEAHAADLGLAFYTGKAFLAKY